MTLGKGMALQNQSPLNFGDFLEEKNLESLHLTKTHIILIEMSQKCAGRTQLHVQFQRDVDAFKRVDTISRSYTPEQTTKKTVDAKESKTYPMYGESSIVKPQLEDLS